MNQATKQLIRSMATCLVLALMLAPGVGAVTTSIGGVSSQGQVQSTNSFSLTPGSEVKGSTVIGFGEELTLSDSIRGWGSGSMAKSASTGTPGRNFASTYAYLDQAESWNWNYRLGTCRCYVGISESLSAVNGIGLFAGGLSYNTRGDYAAAQIRSPAFNSLTYSNTMITNSRGALASQSARNAVGSFQLINWANWGGNEKEIRDPKLFDDPATRDSAFGPMGEPSTQQALAYAYIDSPALPASYSSYADSYYGGARARQSLSSAGLAGLYLESSAKWGDLYTQLSTNAEHASGVRYSSSTTARSGSSSGQQSVKVNAGEKAGSSAMAWIGQPLAPSYEAFSSSLASDPAWMASYSSLDKASARSTQARVDQRLAAIGGQLSRFATSTAQQDMGYGTAVWDILTSPTGAPRSRLSGYASVSASFRNALNSGSWAAYTPDGTDHRYAARGGAAPLEATLKLIGKTRYRYVVQSTPTVLRV